MEIYILRHAIAEQGRAGQSDSERALVPEGKKKLREVLRMARAAGVAPALILTSPYRRALETAEIAADELNCREELVRTRSLIPPSGPEDVWEEIRAHRDTASVMLVGHEPQLSQLIGYLLGAPSLQVDFKKSGLARIDIEQFGPRPRGLLRWLLTPRLALGSEGA